MDYTFKHEFADKYIFYTLTYTLEQKLHRVQQVHGNEVYKTCNLENSEVCADGMTTDKELSIPLCILTADCLPITIIGKNGVGLVHAGWKGVENNISISTEIESLEPLEFFIGPHIRRCCFEVSSGFKENFPQSKYFETRGDSLFFDLEAEVRSRILNKFPQVKIISSNECTCCNDKYFSFRRNKTEKRNWNLLVSKDNDIVIKK